MTTRSRRLEVVDGRGARSVTLTEKGKIAAEARRLTDLEDRVDRRLRWADQRAGLWYMIKGPRYWVRQGKAGWYHGWYYVPGQTYPVVPPKADWPSWNAYHGIPGQSPITNKVPPDIKGAGRYTSKEKDEKDDPTPWNTRIKQQRAAKHAPSRVWFGKRANE